MGTDAHLDGNKSKEGLSLLVLTRKIDESIIIGDNIRVTIVDVRGEQVKLGIDAPRSISVHREEVYREIQEENRRAAALERDFAIDQLSELIPGRKKPDPQA